MGIIFDLSLALSKQSAPLIVWTLNFMEGLDTMLIAAAVATSETAVKKLNGRASRP